MGNIEIFDKDGNKLNVADVIYEFINDTATKHGKSIEDVFIGVDVGFPKGTPIWVHTVESVDNGYDALELIEFGETYKTTK